MMVKVSQFEEIRSPWRSVTRHPSILCCYHFSVWPVCSVVSPVSFESSWLDGWSSYFSSKKNGGIIVATYDMENGVNYLTTRLNFGLPLLVHLKCLYHHGFTKSRRIYYFDALSAILARNKNWLERFLKFRKEINGQKVWQKIFSDMDSDRISDI